LLRLLIPLSVAEGNHGSLHFTIAAVPAPVPAGLANLAPARLGDGRWPFAPVLASGQSFVPKRQRAGALQDASRGSFVTGQRASVLDCGGPPPLSHGAQITNLRSSL
jgi:hypothetical protein